LVKVSFNVIFVLIVVIHLVQTFLMQLQLQIKIMVHRVLYVILTFLIDKNVFICFVFKKTVMTVPTGKVVSRGTSFNCQPASTSDIKIYCCQSNLCNRSNSLKQFVFLVFFPIFYSFYLLIN
jgi:hypothetical protein